MSHSAPLIHTPDGTIAAITKALGTHWILSAPFDPNKETIIQTDSSAHAMG